MLYSIALALAPLFVAIIIQFFLPTVNSLIERSVAYPNIRIICDIRIALANNTFRQLINVYAKYRLLFLDEWLLYPLSVEDSRNLLDAYDGVSKP